MCKAWSTSRTRPETRSWVHPLRLTGVAPPLRRLAGPGTQVNDPQFIVLAFGLFADGFE
jgi:hypothetical protein